MPGESLILVDNKAGHVRSLVNALSHFPPEAQWTVIGGLAVFVRIAGVHRVTNDLDALSCDQTSLVEYLVAEIGAERLSAGKLQLNQDGKKVIIDILFDTPETSPSTEPDKRAFSLGCQMALNTSESIEVVVLDGTAVVAKATAPFASISALIALKSVAIPRRSRGNRPAKVGSDIHDLVRLVQICDLDIFVTAICSAGPELRDWVGNTLVKLFSPSYDLRYTLARLRRLSRTSNIEGLAEIDLARVAEFGHALQT